MKYPVPNVPLDWEVMEIPTMADFTLTPLTGGLSAAVDAATLGWPRAKVYIAARFPRREEMEGYVPKFNEVGLEVVSYWVFGAETGMTREEIAKYDLSNLDEADVLVLFTEPYGSAQVGGGRFVEFGYALAKGKEVHVIGDRENVFIHHPSVKVHGSLDEFLRYYGRVQ